MTEEERRYAITRLSNVIDWFQQFRATRTRNDHEDREVDNMLLDLYAIRGLVRKNCEVDEHGGSE